MRPKWVLSRPPVNWFPVHFSPLHHQCILSRWKGRGLESQVTREQRSYVKMAKKEEQWINHGLRRNSSSPFLAVGDVYSIEWCFRVVAFRVFLLILSRCRVWTIWFTRKLWKENGGSSTNNHIPFCCTVSVSRNTIKALANRNELRRENCLCHIYSLFSSLPFCHKEIENSRSSFSKGLSEHECLFVVYDGNEEAEKHEKRLQVGGCSFFYLQTKRTESLIFSAAVWVCLHLSVLCCTTIVYKKDWRERKEGRRFVKK